VKGLYFRATQKGYIRTRKAESGDMKEVNGKGRRRIGKSKGRKGDFVFYPSTCLTLEALPGV